MRLSAFVTLLLAVLAASVAARGLLADNPGPKPTECSGWRQSWKNDKISCVGCDGRLDCEVEHGHIRTRRLECEFDKGITHRAFKWECKLSNNQYQCDWKEVEKGLTQCALNLTQTIFTVWNPRT